jgi:hypothetical protein
VSGVGLDWAIIGLKTAVVGCIVNYKNGTNYRNNDGVPGSHQKKFEDKMMSMMDA